MRQQRPFSAIIIFKQKMRQQRPFLAKGKILDDNETLGPVAVDDAVLYPKFSNLSHLGLCLTVL